MLYKLLFLFILIPLVELTLLLIIAQVSGHFLWSVALVVITGTVGAWLARRQGVAVIGRIRTQLAQGQTPTDSLVDGAFILVAGALLLTPGVLTDAAGMSMMIPGCRRWYKGHVINWFKRHFQFASFPIPRRADDDDIIDSYVVPGSVQDKPGTDQSDVDREQPGAADSSKEAPHE